ncbi:hypothetical protein FIBSPDRAFT_541550 [Athelia psychrophila]|uniref:BTB domain-containing protein n=1 Tax=Athelia psychrophila TaxID=1759441 RepID=A0A166IZ49_9AGAM|nr:hypothetical protein FIBSPDRAFT_541550 [Fibularhizoctonia sp. CBS 109695]
MPPAAKRQRTDDSDSSDEADIPVVQGTPWFNDGNIIIHAESTRFKVYGGILASKSEIFGDMMSLPTPESTAITSSELSTGGCPVVHVTDSTEDWRHVLEAIFNRMYTFTVDATSLPFPVIRSLLRLGHKYNFVELLAEAMERLTRYFPATIKGWDSPHRNAYIVMPYVASYFELVSLARTLGLPFILPALFYECVTTASLKILLSGLSRNAYDGSSASQLDPSDIQACILGWEAIISLQITTTCAWFTITTLYPDCRDSPRCTNARREILIRYFDSGMTTVMLLNKWDDDWNDDMCRICVKAARAAHEAGRRESWTKLPSAFGLPPWEELLANGGRELLSRLW